MTEKAVRTAVVGVLTTGLAHPLTLQELKAIGAAQLPNYYNEVTVSDRFGGEVRNDAFTGTGAYRITMRSVGKTEDAAYDMRSKGRAALEYAYLSADGHTSTPVLFETAEPIGEDDGYWSGLMTLTATF